MSPKTDTNPVPDLLLERYRLGELPPAEAEALERRLLADGELRGRVEALDRSDAEVRRLLAEGRLAESVRTRLRVRASSPAPPARKRAWTSAALLAAAATVLVALSVPLAGRLVPSPGGPPPSVEPSGDRIKGLQPALVLYRRTPNGSEALADGDSVRQGDLIRVGYRAAGRGFGVIVSIDGRGGVTLHLPENGPRSPSLKTGGTVLLDHAYELDDAPRWERFFFVTSPQPFDVSTVVEAARAAPGNGLPPAALRLPPPLEQSGLSLAKVR